MSVKGFGENTKTKCLDFFQALGMSHPIHAKRRPVHGCYFRRNRGHGELLILWFLFLIISDAFSHEDRMDAQGFAGGHADR